MYVHFNVELTALYKKEKSFKYFNLHNIMQHK